MEFFEQIELFVEVGIQMLHDKQRMARISQNSIV